jgi:hypothetical protein
LDVTETETPPAASHEQPAFIHEEVDIPPRRGPRYILWDEAVELIRQARVTLVMQAHCLVVTLVGIDRQVYKTIEPEIDDALHVVREFGHDGIMYGTE